jgi:AcrR family transcriptional regulator
MHDTMSIKERREREGKARLESILEAAEKVFTDKGYYQARMADIAAASELAKGTLYYYFKSKDEIYLHLLDREARKVHEEIHKRISPESSFLEALEEAFGFYLEYFDKNQAYLKMFLPCMCGTLRFEGAASLKTSVQGYEHDGGFIRKTLQAKIRRDSLPFNLDDMLKFFKTLQVGIGLKLLEGQKAEAKASVRFFLDLVKRVMEDVT